MAKRRHSWGLNTRTLVAVLVSPYFKVLAALGLVAAIGAGFVFMHYYNTYATIIDRRFAGEIFQQTAKIYAAPYLLYPGRTVTAAEVQARLRRAGLEPVDDAPDRDGAYQVLPGETPQIVVSPENAPDYRLEFDAGKLRRIQALPSGPELPEIGLPPELVTNLFDDTRTKRRLITWEQLPPHLIDALIASEDQRFYRHFGIDLIRGAGVALANFRGERLQGASTVTMQLAGNFFLNRRDRTWARKLPEIFMALIMEQRLTKDQILTLYANEVYLGQRGSFAVNGFGEAAAAYFGKDVSDLTVSESATLVGLIPAPNAYSPRNNPERAMERRNIVLSEMYRMGRLDAEQLAAARAQPLEVAEIKIDVSDAPYMVDYVRQQLLADFTDDALVTGGLRVYTTLDPDLQRAAVAAVQSGLAFVDAQLDEMDRRRPNAEPRPPVQATLIALDPRTGEIKAMVGGRDYLSSQYNRITEAFRQPGSIFKPLVFAAAFESAFNPLPEPEPEFSEGFEGFDADDIDPVHQQELAPQARAGATFQRASFRQRGADDPVDGLIEDLEIEALPERQERGTLASVRIVTPLTTVMDEPTLFFYDQDKFYEPNNYREVFYGMIPIREAMQRSLNIPTVKVAERIGYDRVSELAHRLGLNGDIRPYPSIALGAFEVTPIEMAGAYTAFANGGLLSPPHAIREVRDADGAVVESYQPETRQAIAPEIAGVMTHLMENVVNRGTGAGVRSRGFTLPAAGKTGTSRDGWFAGYTHDLLAIAWVGFDDNRELNLEGSRSALPIWTEFMLEAYRIHPVRDPEATRFQYPPGMEIVTVDAHTMALATPYCDDTFEQAFIYGTAPTGYCPIHSAPGGFFLSRGVRSFGRFLSDLF